MSKRIMAMLLTFVMVFTVIPTNIVSVFATENNVQAVQKTSENDGRTEKQLTMDAGEILENLSDFSDVSKDSWYYDSVKYVKENGIFSGVSANQFDPKGGATRF